MTTVLFTVKTREATPFTWSASCGMPVYATLAGVRFDRLFLDADAIAEAYTIGRPMAEALFGADVATGGPTWAGISYGHANSLGAKLEFPEDSEVGHTPIYDSMSEGMAALEKDVDFRRQGMFPFYLELWEKLKRAFPNENIPFHFKAEGPITTAWLLRGHDFFMDLMTEPGETKEFLRLVTESVIAYKRTIQRINGLPEISPEACGLADDIAAMVPPDHWPELVLPFFEQYFEGLMSGRRRAHIEDLAVPHLKYLDELGLSNFDPSVSPKLTAKLIRDNCHAPFQWRLNSTHYVGRSPADVERWVYEAVSDGASGIFTYVAREMCNPEDAAKVRAFIRAANQVKKLLDDGCRREDILRRVE